MANRKSNKKGKKKLVIEAIFTDEALVDQNIWLDLFNYLDSQGVISPP